jgi:ribosomal protein S18 acetylase RimI-like enzyme
MSSACTEVVTIRRAGAGDEPRLAEIDALTWSPLVSPGPRPEGPAFYRGDLTPENTLVAVVDGEVAGYALVTPPTPLPASAHVQMLRGLAVDPAFQGRGIGRALVDAAVAEAAVRGAVKIWLRVLATNDVALRLYAAAGFETEGVLRDEFLLDGRMVDDHLLARRLET